jgi:multicomponent Na+:H+ antiporter subunit E
MLRHVSHAIFLVTVWLLISGHYDPLLISLGIASALFVTWISARMDVVDHEAHPAEATLRFIRTWPGLAVEIIRSNFDVARRILRPDLDISPVCFTVTATQTTAMGRVAYANSITLTPGTVTIDVDGNRFRVHALSSAGRATLESGSMDARITAVERKPK